jgi:2-oxo-3-hexenedioate decarboxylase
MTDLSPLQTVDRIAQEALGLLGSGRQVSTFSSRYAGFNLTMAYEVAARIRAMRETRGERPVGRKIGFTNRTVWSGYGISGPIWNTMFDDTASEPSAAEACFALNGLPEPRIEPEIVLHLQTAPRPGMTDDELAACVDWFAPGFEIVSSIFPGWTFSAADAVAAYGVHSALIVGARRDISGDRAWWRQRLEKFTVDLRSDDGVHRAGAARNVLGGPLKSLQFLVDELARLDSRDPLRAGEIVTTGTLTEAMPAVAGQTWSASFDDQEIQGLQLRFT